jgi:hypothetical protein
MILGGTIIRSNGGEFVGNRMIEGTLWILGGNSK